MISSLTQIRGAGASKGRTSWTSRPEQHDYISFAGFLIHYIHDLEPQLHVPAPTPSSPVSHKLSPIQSTVQSPAPSHGMTLILGGYSYGSLVTINLPPIGVILEHFNHVTKGSAEAEIRLRAVHLSKEWNAQALAEHRRRGRSLIIDGQRKNPRSPTFGGEESQPGTRRGSRDSRRSIDAVRRSLDRSRARLSLGRKPSGDLPYPLPIEEKLESIDIAIAVHYLLISPILPPISSFITMFSKQWPFRKAPDTASQPNRKLSLLSGHEKFWLYPTMAIYGDSDGFTSQQKVHKWAQNMSDRTDSLFQSCEVPGAGHFWHEEGVVNQMQDGIRGWAATLADQ